MRLIYRHDNVVTCCGFDMGWRRKAIGHWRECESHSSFRDEKGLVMRGVQVRCWTRYMRWDGEFDCAEALIFRIVKFAIDIGIGLCKGTLPVFDPSSITRALMGPSINVSPFSFLTTENETLPVKPGILRIGSTRKVVNDKGNT